MPRQYKIKWSTKDRQQLSKAVQQFNSKLTRTLKKHPELKPYLPERLTVQGLKEQIKTRNDLNREVNSAKRFLRKGAEMPYTSQSGIKTTVWERREIGIKVGVINRRKARERKAADVSTYKGTMGSIRENNLLPKKYNIDKIRPSDWDKFVESVEKQVASTYSVEKQSRYKANYIKGALNIFSHEDAQAINSIVNRIPDEEFTQLFYDDPVLQLDFVYDPLEAHFKAEQIMEHLQARGYSNE